MNQGKAAVLQQCCAWLQHSQVRLRVERPGLPFTLNQRASFENLQVGREPGTGCRVS